MVGNSIDLSHEILGAKIGAIGANRLALLAVLGAKRRQAAPLAPRLAHGLAPMAPILAPRAPRYRRQWRSVTERQCFFSIIGATWRHWRQWLNGAKIGAIGANGANGQNSNMVRIFNIGANVAKIGANLGANLGANIHDFGFLYAHDIRDNRFENNAKFVKTSKL